jgi:arsenite-transporting ATPase
MREDLSGHALKLLPLMNFLVLYREKQKEKNLILSFSTPPQQVTPARLLELPAAWSSFTDENPDGASCLGPTSALKRKRKIPHRSE